MVLLSQVRNVSKRLPMIKFRAAPSHKPEPVQTIIAAQQPVKSSSVSIIKHLSQDPVKVLSKTKCENSMENFM